MLALQQEKKKTSDHIAVLEFYYEIETINMPADHD